MSEMRGIKMVGRVVGQAFQPANSRKAGWKACPRYPYVNSIGAPLRRKAKHFIPDEYIVPSPSFIRYI